MGILDLVFPKYCLGCKRVGKYLCQACIDLTPRAEAVCPYCKHPSIDGATHTNCQRRLGINGLTSIWRYNGVIRSAILSLKYKYATEIGNELSDHLISSLKELIVPPVQFLTPIPIYWYRQNTRGFNQSLEMGKMITSAMGWKFIPNLLIKRYQTVSQVELSGEKRRKNLKNVFSLNPIYKSVIRTFKSIAIFDDVFTTGSTMMEAGKALKKAGVEKVWGLTVAR